MPISEAFPTQEDKDSTERLIQTLKDQGLEVVLGKLDKMVKEFVYTISLRRNHPESIAREAGGKIFTFGSYRLGVHGSGKFKWSDIDTLCVVPKHVQREDFFEEMYEMLRRRPEVTELTAVPDAFTPVIGMKFSEIPIDLTFARLGLSSVPDTLDLSDDSLLRNLDDRCIRSVNGSRVTDEILRLVPNIPAFRTALRCVKLWAQRRAIYSNMMGFLGGVAWAMLVARVCQLYPNACAATIISRPWPQPVLLKPIEEGPLQVRVWNPKLYPADKAHKMPIITPAYPSMCSTHNVTDSTKAVMLSEFKDGKSFETFEHMTNIFLVLSLMVYFLDSAADLVSRIMVERTPWSTLFVKDDFFSRYRHYLQVIASSDTEERHLRWSGFVESRIRHLVTKLERVDNLVLAHPYIKGFSKVIQYKTAAEKEDAAHGIVHTAGASADPVDTKDDSSESETMYTSVYYIGLCIPARQAGSTGHRKMDLFRPKDEFTEMLKSWDKFDAQSMGIVVQHIRSSELPSEVLDGVDLKKTKRSKSGKKSATVDTRPPNKKRRGSVGQQGGALSDASPAPPAETPGILSESLPVATNEAPTAVPSVIPQA
ncbi:polynucleotide adenylyltransferase [Dissophora globulifera]|uniref:Poly(A) polymerase n=1 Tax=Dissophora globulifera TaxID=979702 RepID=A0A9P6RUG8_9FUNG|nr:polynucleotide adenylyltransferase [Dissophora globulifera]